MTPDEYRHQSERAHERRQLLKRAEDLIDERHGPGLAQVAEATRLILRAVERLSFADERTLEMRRECGAMIEHCTKAIQLGALSAPQTIVISRDDLPAALKAGVRDAREDDHDEIGGSG